MMFEFPAHALPRLAGLVADASDSDGTSELVIRLSIKTEDGEQPSDEEVEELRVILEAYGSDGPLDSRVATHGELPDKPGSK
jgi:hypothetical protein